MLTDRNAISLNVLHTIYGLHPDNQRYCLKLKNRIMKDFKEILTSQKKMSDIVVDGSALRTEITFKYREGCIIKPHSTWKMIYWNTVKVYLSWHAHHNVVSQEWRTWWNMLVFLYRVRTNTLYKHQLIRMVNRRWAEMQKQVTELKQLLRRKTRY